MKEFLAERVLSRDRDACLLSTAPRYLQADSPLSCLLQGERVSVTGEGERDASEETDREMDGGQI